MAGIRILRTPEDFSHYDAWVKSHPQKSLWQSLEWKRYQEALGREVRIYIAEAPHPALSRGERDHDPSPSPLLRGDGTFLASALVVIDRTAGGWSTWDIPRGPLCQLSCVSFHVSGNNAATQLLDVIAQDAKRDRCLALFLSPSAHLEAGSWPSAPRLGLEEKLEASHRHEQPEVTRMIDLTQTEDNILAQMHPKGRYNIRVAQKHGVRMEESRDIDTFYALLRKTAGRDGFRILPLRVYRAFLENLPGSFLLMAFPPSKAPHPSPLPRGEGKHSPKSLCRPIAGLLGLIWEQTGIYYYGASSYAHRALMAPYALQWEAMRQCKAKGCAMYDLLGVVPPVPLSPIPSPAAAGEGGTPHPWAGVSAFKEKFGGTVVTYPPEQQIVLRPMLWRVLQWKRRVIG